MKFAVVFLLLPVACGFVVRFSAPKSLRCWMCEEAGSDAHCFRIGRWIQCEPAQSCYVEQRYENGIEIHKRGCKQNTACKALVSQNEFQCNAILFKKLLEKGSRSPITCRHCCSKSFCNPTETAQTTMNQIRGFRPAAFPTRFPRRTRPRTKPTVPATTAPSKRKKVELGEVFYPGIGWIALSRVDEERPTPPPIADDPKKSSKGNISGPLYESLHAPVEMLEVKKRQRTKRRKETCTSAQNPMVPTPEKLKPKEECVIQAPTSCLEDGTLVFQMFKLEGAIARGSSDERNLSDVKCIKTPSMETAVVYDNEDHYIMVMRINQRTEAKLPERRKGKHFIGDAKLIDVIDRLDLRRFRGGNG